MNANKINEYQNKLNSKFINAYIANNDTDKDRPSFIDDGLVDAESWINTPIKILFFLKEINTGGEPDDRWSLSGLFSNIAENNASGNTVIAQMAKISRTLISCHGKDDEQNFDPSVLDYSFLKHISLVNCKKNSGGATVSWEIVETFANRYKNLLREQIDLIKPNVIYCCGYSDSANKSMKNIYESIMDVNFTSKLYWSYPAEIYEHNGVYLISAFHPSYIAETTNTLNKLIEVAKYIKLQ